MITSVPAYSTETGDVGNLETNPLCQDKMKSHLSASQGKNPGEVSTDHPIHNPEDRITPIRAKG